MKLGNFDMIHYVDQNNEYSGAFGGMAVVPNGARWRINATGTFVSSAVREVS
jgi:hypothetical protein